MSRGFASNARMTLLVVSLLGCFAAVAGRLVYLHVIGREDMLKHVERARQQLLSERARRGNIFDCRGAEGHLLATSRPEITLAVDPWALVELLVREKNRVRRERLQSQETLKHIQLANLIGLPWTEVEQAFKPRMRTVPVERDTRDGKRDGWVKDRWVKLREGIDEETFKKIEELNVRGVTSERIYRRVYPGGSLAAHLLGFVNREGVPVTGVERHFDLYLRGQDGWIESEHDGARRELAQFRSREVPVQDGYAVALTIDSMIQHMIEAELAGLARTFSPAFATIIVSDPTTGAILGLANHPTFDLNQFNKAPAEVQRNRAVTDIIEPGSTFKIVAAAGALNERLVAPETRFDCSNPTAEYRGRMVRLMRDDHPFEHLTVAEIIAHSSNRGAARLGMLLGEERLHDYARRFGFGQFTGFPLGGEVRGMLEAPKHWDGLTITRLPTGHAVAATPLQIHFAMSAVANGGVLLRPQLIQEVRDPAGAVVRRLEPEVRGRVMAPSTAATLAQLLTRVASKEGTAIEAAIPNFDVAGKTGTTQEIIDGKYSTTHHVASFVGFFPASRPRVVISVIVDDARVPTGGPAYGRIVAAPAFKRVGEQLIQYLDIKPVASSRLRFVALEDGAR
jgi:cell division protein FtsI/penicillin-binding protein 2